MQTTVAKLHCKSLLNADAVRVLIEAGAAVDHADADGWTALHLAADEGHVEAIVVLVQAGAEVNRATDDGLTPLAAARANNYQAAAHALMRAGAAH
jgi:ankyrin repeat protein